MLQSVGQIALVHCYKVLVRLLWSNEHLRIISQTALKSSQVKSSQVNMSRQSKQSQSVGYTEMVQRKFTKCWLY